MERGSFPFENSLPPSSSTSFPFPPSSSSRDLPNLDANKVMNYGDDMFEMMELLNRRMFDAFRNDPFFKTDPGRLFGHEIRFEDLRNPVRLISFLPSFSFFFSFSFLLLKFMFVGRVSSALSPTSFSFFPFLLLVFIGRAGEDSYERGKTRTYSTDSL